MRILSILPFSPPSAQFGGAERQMHSLHKGLIAKGIEVQVLADILAVERYHQIFEGVPIWGLPFPVLTSNFLRPGNLKIVVAWRKILNCVLTRIPRPDLIHVTTFRQPALIGYWLAKELRVPWVVRIACSGSYGDFQFAGGNWLCRRELPRMAKSVAGVIAIDSATRLEAINAGVAPNRIEIIPNAPVLTRPPNSREMSQSVVFIGRLAKQKRVDSLLVAYSLLLNMIEGMHPSLVVAGYGAERGDLEQLAGKLRIAGECTFLGNVAGPEDVLDGAGCFVNPSESEGNPNAVLEALAFGVPVILSDIPIHREIATAVGMEDFLFPIGDSKALAEKLRQFLCLGNLEQQILRRQCSAYGQGFTTPSRDDAYINFYHRILATSSEKC